VRLVLRCRFIDLRTRAYAMANDLLLYDVRDGIATLTMNEPHKLNPISVDLQRQMRNALAQVREDRDVGVLVLTGAGQAFSVGADLGTLADSAAADGKTPGQWVGDAMLEVTNPLALELRALPVPTVAAVNGAVAGGSVGLALNCDVVVAAQSAYFYLPFATQLGIVPDVGATWWLPRLAGTARSMGAVLLENRITAEQAERWGLIWRAVDDAAFQETVADVARRLARLPAHAALEARRAFEGAHGRGLAEQLYYEADRQRALIDRDTFAEGVRAFAEKRKPVFKGRGASH